MCTDHCFATVVEILFLHSTFDHQLAHLVRQVRVLLQQTQLLQLQLVNLILQSITRHKQPLRHNAPII